jgi:hypothetical protein
MFSPKVGAFAEAGYGVSFLKLGFTFMFWEIRFIF